MIRHLQERETNKSRQPPPSHTNENTGDNGASNLAYGRGEEPSKRPETAGDIFKLAMSGAQRASSSRPPSSALDVLKSAQTGRQILKSKETSVSSNRAFIDRQENASRVSSIDSIRGSPVEDTSRGDQRKRKAAASPSDDSLFCGFDSEFETDRRPTKQRRVERQVSTRPHRTERASTSILSSAHDLNDSDSEFETDRRPSKQRRLVRQPIAHPAGAERASGVIRDSVPPATVNDSETDSDSSMSRVIRGSEESNVPRFLPSAGRKRWTDDEIKALKKYIKIYGPQFARIKTADSEKGEYLKDRTPPNLKDKARDLAFMFWK